MHDHDKPPHPALHHLLSPHRERLSLPTTTGAALPLRFLSLRAVQQIARVRVTCLYDCSWHRVLRRPVSLHRQVHH